MPEVQILPPMPAIVSDKSSTSSTISTEALANPTSSAASFVRKKMETQAEFEGKIVYRRGWVMGC
jgi:hypothetical protein